MSLVLFFIHVHSSVFCLLVRQVPQCPFHYEEDRTWIWPFFPVRGNILWQVHSREEAVAVKVLSCFQL